MPSPIISLSLLAAFVHLVAARHVHTHKAHLHHHRHHHNHARHQAVIEVKAAAVGDGEAIRNNQKIPTVNSTTNEPMMMDVISHADEVKRDNVEVPENLLKYIQAVDVRMVSVEAALGTLMASATEAPLETTLPSGSPAAEGAGESLAPIDAAESNPADLDTLASTQQQQEQSLQAASTSPSNFQPAFSLSSPSNSPVEEAAALDEAPRASTANIAPSTSTVYATVTSFLWSAAASSNVNQAALEPASEMQNQEQMSGLALTQGSGSGATAWPTTFATVTSSRMG